MIPKVRTWLVNYWRDVKVVASHNLWAPTKPMATRAANDIYGWPSSEMQRTITPVRSTRGAGKAAAS